MLSLGLGITRSAARVAKEDFHLISNSPPVNFFNSFSVEGTPGSLTFTADQAAPDASTGWLKIQYPDSDQTSISGLQKSNMIEEAAVKQGKKWKLKFDIFLETAADWLQGGADNTTVQMGVLFGNRYYFADVTPDQSVSIDTGIQTVAVDDAERLTIYFNAENDLPESEAVFYIKNFDMQMGNSDSIFS